MGGFTAVNRLLAAGAEVLRLDAPLPSISAAVPAWPPGAFVVRRAPDREERQRNVVARLEKSVRQLGLAARALDAPPPGTLLPLRAPRIGLYHAWGGNIDEGWTRWVLEQFEFLPAGARRRPARGRPRGALRRSGAAGHQVAADARGSAPRPRPARVRRRHDSTGAYHLYELARRGGTLVALDGAAGLPLTLFAPPLRDVTARLEQREFFIPGARLRLQVDPTHPLAFGMPEDATAFFAQSPAFQVGREATRLEKNRGIEPATPAGVTVAARWADDEKDLLRSGWVLAGSTIAGKAAVVEAKVGDGRVVLLGLRAQHRGQPHGTFKLLFNALYRGRGPWSPRHPRRASAAQAPRFVVQVNHEHRPSRGGFKG